jgi:hypothetical protein
VLYPIYFLIVYKIVLRIFKRYYSDKLELKREFKQAFFLKIIGSLFIALIYRYYYGSGDTDFYFRGGISINHFLIDDPITYFKMVFGLNTDYYNKYANLHIYYYNTIDKSTALMMSLISLLGLLSANTYLVIALFFAVISFFGSWYLYRTVCALYPESRKKIYYAIFLTPTILIWSSSVLKDSICLASLLTLISLIVRIIQLKEPPSIKKIILIVFTGWVLYILKVYILIAFIPFLGIYLLSTLLSKIQNDFLRNVFFIFLFLILAFGVYQNLSNISGYLQAYALDTLLERVGNTFTWVNQGSEQGARYDLGIDYTSWSSLLASFPKGINVTLFRPYPWESKKIIVLISGIESSIIFLLTLYVLFRTGFIQSILTIGRDRFLLMIFGFCISFAFIIGVSTGNFGSLVRYKLPIMPLYMILLVILNSRLSKKKDMETPLAESK